MLTYIEYICIYIYLMFIMLIMFVNFIKENNNSKEDSHASSIIILSALSFILIIGLSLLYYDDAHMY